MNFCLTETTITEIESNNEKFGTMEESMGNEQLHVKRQTREALKECGISANIDDVRKTLRGWCIYVHQDMSHSEKSRLKNAIQAKVKGHIEVVATAP